MVKNLPLLIAILVIGISLSNIALKINMPSVLQYILQIVGILLMLWGMIALILHVGMQRLNKKR